MTDLDKLRAFAQGLIDEAAHVVDECGVVGGHVEVTRAEVARRLLAELDAMPPLTSPDRIPPILRQSIDDYRDHGLRPDQFLCAVLAGDLFGAMARADEPSMLALPAIVTWIRSELPDAAMGSYASVDGWIKRRIVRPRS